MPGLTQRHVLQIDCQPVGNHHQSGGNPVSDCRFQRASHRARRFADSEYDQASPRIQKLTGNLDLVTVPANGPLDRARGIYRLEGGEEQFLETGSGEPLRIHKAGAPAGPGGLTVFESTSAG
jgi:hypothetical protein